MASSTSDKAPHGFYSTKSRFPQARDLFNNELTYLHGDTGDDGGDDATKVEPRSAFQGAQMKASFSSKPFSSPAYQLEDGEPDPYEDGHLRGEQERKLGFGTNLPLSRDDLSSVLEVQRYRTQLQKELHFAKAFEAKRHVAGDANAEAARLSLGDHDKKTAVAPAITKRMVLATPEGVVTLQPKVSPSAAHTSTSSGAQRRRNGGAAWAPPMEGLAADRPVFKSGYDQSHSEQCIGGEDRFGTTNLASSLAAGGRGITASQSWRPEPLKIHSLHLGVYKPSSTDINGGAKR